MSHRTLFVLLVFSVLPLGLSRAVALGGATLDPAEAGKMFPFKWKS